ncbi:MAG: hypothetical protein IAF02_08755 [Anaerolineae bacterium]|nr:hypothetical protein [Anaerolineae bacterium]
MRVYRLAILTSLAGLTVILLGTAVYALQTPSSPPATSNALHKITQQENPLRAQKQGADYLAIVADEPGFMNALTPLLTHREETGLQVTAVSLAQITAEFGDGEVSPQAIRDFLQFTATHWQPAPQFILLVGDATFDDQLNDNNLLPTHMLQTEDGSFAACDSWYTTFDSTSSTPPAAIGRFPVQTAAQLTAVIRKTIAYETAVTQSPDEPWLQRALLIADDEPYFDIATDHLEDNLNRSGYYIHDFHMSQNQDIYPYITTVLNRGVGILNYSGHGSETNFAEGIAFTADDARLLQNEHRLPIFTAFSCQNGTFTDPNQDSISEELLLTENGGVVAAIGTSGRMKTHDSLLLSNIFYQHLLHDSATTLGDVLMKTKTAVHDNDDLATAVQTYNLLGDPALQLHHPPQSQIVKPIPLSGATTLVNDK